MPALSMSAVALFLAATIFQLIGVVLLPATKGMTAFLPALGVAAGYGIGVSCMSRLIYTGVNLSLLIPLITLTIILASVGVGVLFYGESAPPIKIALLLVAAVMIGVASRY